MDRNIVVHFIYHEIMKGKEEGGTGFSKGWQAASRNFPRAGRAALRDFLRAEGPREIPKKNPKTHI